MVASLKCCVPSVVENVAQAEDGGLDGVLAAERCEEVDDHIGGDQPECHILQLYMLQAVGIVERNEHPILAVLAGDP